MFAYAPQNQAYQDGKGLLRRGRGEQSASIDPLISSAPKSHVSKGRCDAHRIRCTPQLWLTKRALQFTSFCWLLGASDTSFDAWWVSISPSFQQRTSAAITLAFVLFRARKLQETQSLISDIILQRCFKLKRHVHPYRGRTYIETEKGAKS